jgi:hypothetical protein
MVSTLVVAPATAGWSSEGALTVTDASITVHDGFDRVVFEMEGDGDAGWAASYVDEAISDRDGLSVPVAGSSVLRISLTGIGASDGDVGGAAAFEDDLPGLDGGIILEVVNDGVFDGQHTFFVGLDQQLPFRLLRVDEPKGIVLDVLRDTDADPDAAVAPEVEADTEADVEAPAGGVDAGFGGVVDGSPLATALRLGGLLLLAVGALSLAGRRRAT